MNNVDKVTVVAKEGNAKILTGEAYVKLEECSKDQFDTNRLEDFVNYVNSYNDHDLPVYVSQECIEFYDGVDVTHATVPLARANIEKTKFMNLFMQMIDKSTTIESAETLLHSLLEYGDAAVMTLYNFTRNCNISAVSEFIRQIDDGGNYNLLMKREGKGDKRVRPVEAITFTVPVLKMHKETFSFPFKVSMDYKTDNGMKVSFTFTNYQLQEAIESAIYATIMLYLEKLNKKIPVYWGKRSIIKATDSWRYQVLDR